MKNITRLVVGPVATNCWIYPIDDKTAAIIDPGEKADLIISTLEKLSLSPAFILLTHGHFDHITALPKLAKHYAPAKPVIAIHRLDEGYLEKGLANRLLEEGDTIGPFTVLHLPGHTRGSAAFWDRAENILFTGDTLFEGTYGRTDLPGGSEQEIIASLRRLFALDGSIAVYPGHEETTTIGQEAVRGMI
jgi:glyoxylase-like metal-dependent hydrolase (beta-lactamase superfamily II)